MASGVFRLSYLNRLCPGRSTVPLRLRRLSGTAVLLPVLPLDITGFFPAVLIVVSQLHQHPE